MAVDNYRKIVCTIIIVFTVLIFLKFSDDYNSHSVTVNVVEIIQPKTKNSKQFYYHPNNALLDNYKSTTKNRKWSQSKQDDEELTYSKELKFVLSEIKRNPFLQSIANKENKQLGFVNNPKIPKFSCNPFRLNCSATSVHKLTPSDISVIGAVGDSLTAANGANAKTIFGILINYRGYSFTAGGQDTYETNPTLPNLFRQYNKHLTGYSTGNGGPNSKHAGLNLAVHGAKSISIDEQVRRLIYRMKNDPYVNFERDWKLVNVFIGQNDICGYCKKPDLLTPEHYRSRLQIALDLLEQNMPRTFVNVISPLDVFLVHQLNLGVTCTALHMLMCRCAAFPHNETFVQQLNDNFQKSIRKLIESGRYDKPGRDDFTVVLQPFFEKTNLPRVANKSTKVDLSYFAPDCFHFNRLGHWEAALALWNNMWQGIADKNRVWTPGETYQCPTVDKPYIATYKNSK